jgi:hypothetical protein
VALPYGRDRGEDASGGHGRGWRWFAAWLVVGGLVSCAALTGLSIGALVAPIAVVALVWVARRASHAAEAAGALAGVGAFLIVVAFLNRDYRPCPAGELSLPAGTPAGTAVSCGGLDPVPWLVSGAALAALALAVYGAYRLRASRRTGG